MRCPRCEVEAPSDAEFCPRCGAKLCVVCPQCGTANAPDHNFCKKCGQALTGALRSGTLASPQAYTPRHLAEKILTSRTALEGERKQVTVLFCDIVDSSRLAEQLDAEAMHEVMDRTLRLMAEAVHRYEGEALADETLQAPPINLLGRAHFMRGEVEQACELLTRSVEQMRAIGNPMEEATASGILALACGHLGRFAEALEAGDNGVRIAKKLEHLPTLAACLQYRGQLKCWRGDWTGFQDFQEGLEFAKSSGDLFRTYVIHGIRGLLYGLAGNYERAIEDLRRAVMLAERLGTQFFLGGYKSALSESLLYAGNVLDAIRLSQEALHIANESGQPWEQSFALRALAQTLLAQDPPDCRGAEDAISNAIAIQERLRMKWELAQSLVVHGRVHRIKGATAEARATLRRALHLFEEMGVTWGVARAQQALSEF